MHVHAHMQVKNMSVMYGSQPDRVAGLTSKDMLGFIANINVATCTCSLYMYNEYTCTIYFCLHKMCDLPR